MAALRARSFGRLGFAAEVLVVDCAPKPASVTGLDTWASASEILTLGFSIAPDCSGAVWSPVSREGPVSLISGIGPAIEVSGTPSLRGGGGNEARECGRYAVAV